MNKSDIKLILIILSVSIIFIVILKLNNNVGDYALVYYQNQVVKKIDLKLDKEYILDGYNGEIIIEVKSGKIRVKKETSPRHLCSKQGWISTSLEPIVCLPNKIVIKIEKENTDVDTVVR